MESSLVSVSLSLSLICLLESPLVSVSISKHLPSESILRLHHNHQTCLRVWLYGDALLVLWRGRGDEGGLGGAGGVGLVDVRQELQGDATEGALVGDVIWREILHLNGDDVVTGGRTGGKTDAASGLKKREKKLLNYWVKKSEIL